MTIVLLSWIYSYSFTDADGKLSAQFCKSLNIGLQIYEEEIQLTNMNKVNRGHIRMPESHVNRSVTRVCNVTFSGSGNGIIIFHHQRLSNATSGLCLRDTVINDTISEGPCSDQRVYFSRVKKIALAIGTPIQDDFILHFTGMQKMAHDLVQVSKVQMLNIASVFPCLKVA